MKTRLSTLVATTVLLASTSVAHADFGMAVKAGTLGLGIEGRWSPIEWLDVRVGMNQYDYEDTGSRAGINYDGTLALDSLYATGNFRFPLSPFRVTAGVFSNDNELQLASTDSGGSDFTIGGVSFTSADVGTLSSITSFGDTAPYIGFGYDFEVFDKFGLNLDLGVLWQGEPNVTLEATGLAASSPAFQAALEAERQEIEDDLSSYKAWPVLALGFVYNF